MQRAGRLTWVCWPQGTQRALIRPIDNEAYMLEHLRTPLAMHSKGRTVLVENIEISTSLSGIIRLFEGYELQFNAATIINAVSCSLLSDMLPQHSVYSEHSCLWGSSGSVWHVLCGI